MPLVRAWFASATASRFSLSLPKRAAISVVAAGLPAEAAWFVAFFNSETPSLNVPLSAVFSLGREFNSH